jgi:hypothetical protein
MAGAAPNSNKAKTERLSITSSLDDAMSNNGRQKTAQATSLRFSNNRRSVHADVRIGAVSVAVE